MKLTEKYFKNLIRIVNMEGEPQYKGKTGEIKYIDDAKQIHGTWGGCALIPDVDIFELLPKEESNLSIMRFKNYEEYLMISLAIENMYELNEYCIIYDNNAIGQREIFKKVFDDYTVIEGYDRRTVLIRNDVKFDDVFNIEIYLSSEDNSLRMQISHQPTKKIGHTYRIDFPEDYFIQEKINEKNPELFKKYTRTIKELMEDAERSFKSYKNLFKQISDDDKLFMEISE